MLPNGSRSLLGTLIRLLVIVNQFFFNFSVSSEDSKDSNSNGGPRSNTIRVRGGLFLYTNQYRNSSIRIHIRASGTFASHDLAVHMSSFGTHHVEVQDRPGQLLHPVSDFTW